MATPNSRLARGAGTSQVAVLALVLIAGVTRAELAEVVRAVRKVRRRQNPQRSATKLLVKVAPW